MQSLKSTPTRESNTYESAESRRIRAISDSENTENNFYFEQSNNQNYGDYIESESLLLNGSLNELLDENLIKVNLPNIESEERTHSNSATKSPLEAYADEVAITLNNPCKRASQRS
jgi:hypothetical protein